MTFQFKAFISYSHEDIIWSKWLQQKLETYEIPGKLNFESTFPWNADELKTLHPVFRDETELPACGSLPKEIEKYLDLSYTLIVLCSPSSINSRWVKKEISYYQENHSGRRIIPVVLPDLSAETNSLETGNSDLRYYPLELLGDITNSNSLEMPLAAKFPNSSLPNGNDLVIEKELGNEVLKIIAGILNVSLGILKERDKIYTRHKKASQNLPRIQEHMEQAYTNFDLPRAQALSCLLLQCKEALSDHSGAEAVRLQIAILRSVLPKLCSILNVACGGRIDNFERNQNIVPIENGETLTLANVLDGKIILEKTFTEHKISHTAVDASGKYLMILIDNILIYVYKCSNLSEPLKIYEVMGKSFFATISCNGDIAYLNSNDELWLIHKGKTLYLNFTEEDKESTGIWQCPKFSNDGKYIAAALSKTRSYVAVWEIGDNIVLCGSYSNMEKGEDEALDMLVEMHFSQDSSLLAVRYLDESCLVFKLPNLRLFEPRPLQFVRSKRIILSEDNSQILVNEGFNVCIVDINTGKQHTRIPFQEDLIDLLGFITGTSWFYTVVGKTIKVWNNTIANAQMCFHFTLPNKVTEVFTNHTFLSAFTEDKSFITWNLQTLPIFKCLTSFEQKARLSGFCGNGKYAYIVYDSYKITIWKLMIKNFEPLSRCIGGCLEVTSRSTGIFCMEEGKRFSYYDFKKNEKKEFGELDIHFPLDRMAISSDGHIFAYVRFVGSAGWIMSTRTGYVRNLRILDASACTKLVFSPNGCYIALGHLDGGVAVYNTDSGEPYLTIPPHFSEISGLAFSYDNNLLAICDRGKMVRVWEVSRKLIVYSRKMEYQLREVIIERSGHYLAALDFDARYIALIDRNFPDNITNLNISRICGHNVTVQSMCFAWNGEVLLAGLSNGVFTAWDTKSGKLVLPFLNIDGSSIEEISYSMERPLLFRTSCGLYYLDCRQTSESEEQIFAEAKLFGGQRFDFEDIYP